MKTIFRLQFLFCLGFFSSPVFSQQGMWTWISGTDVVGDPGVYGTQGIPSVSNYPPGLYEYSEWKDLQGNFWLYGGWDPGYSDLWKYNPLTNEWTWVKGNGSTFQAPVYGTLGVPDPANTPGERSYCAVSWVDVNGNLWLFGGSTTRNDLWKYDISTNEWTWTSGSNLLNSSAVFGTKGVPSAANVPGATNESCSAWTDSLNNLWMFGGGDYNYDNRNDLWRYSITTNEWTWMSGSGLPNTADVYGTKGIPSATNCPGGRTSYAKWKDPTGNFWLMGGAQYPQLKDDVWKFDPGTNQWTWMAGTNAWDDPGVYQTTCTLDSINRPGSRLEHRSTVQDNCGRFWLFGGMTPNSTFLNDLWVFDHNQAKWMWVSGTNTPNQPNNYGIMGVPAATNSPASRWGSISWWGDDDKFYLFGGNNNNVGPNFGDLWVYTPDNNCTPDCNALPIAIFSAPNHICPGSCINFNNISLNASSYLWIFTGASISVSTDENPQNVCYNTPGNYGVTLIATNVNGSDTITLANYIAVYPFPPAQGISQGGDTLYANQGAVTYQWYYNNVLINGATNYFYVASQSGNYNVVCTDVNDCEVEAAIFDVTAAVQSPGENNMITIHPNPVKNELVIEPGKFVVRDVRIISATGKVVMDFSYTNPSIDVSSLSAGFYFIEFRNNESLFRSSFLKEN
jgi:PKD repeat protein